jgi:hypothetical protein
VVAAVPTVAWSVEGVADWAASGPPVTERTTPAVASAVPDSISTTPALAEFGAINPSGPDTASGQRATQSHQDKPAHDQHMRCRAESLTGCFGNAGTARLHRFR